MFKRMVCIVLALVMLLCVVSCNQEVEDDDRDRVVDLKRPDKKPKESLSSESESESEHQGGEEEPEHPLVTLEVPRVGEDGFEGFGGKEIVILQRRDFENEFYSERETGQLIPDAIYRRNQYVQDYLDVNLGFAASPGRESQNQLMYIENAVFNGKNVYHVSANFAAYAVEWIGYGLFTDLNSIPEEQNYLDFSKPWWNQSYSREATVYGKQFFAVGDATTSAITRLELLIVNESLLEDFVGIEIGDLFQMIYNRQWDYETFLQYVASVGNSITAGAVLQCNATSADGFLGALAVPIAERYSDGSVALTYDSQRTVEIANALRDLYQNNPYVYSESGHSYDLRFIHAFNQEGAIFYAGLLSDAADHLKRTTFQYAVIPFPIWEAGQGEYRVCPHDEYSVLGILSNVTELKETTAVLEVIAARSYETLRPVLCEVTYQYRYLATPEKVEMFNFILDHSYYDFGYIYSMAMGGPVQWLLRAYVVYDEKFPEHHIYDLESEIEYQLPNHLVNLESLLLDIMMN